MRITRAIMASIVLTIPFAGQTVYAAQTATVTKGVTVIRGDDDPQAAGDRRLNRERAGVTVFRGSAPPYVPEPPLQEISPQQVLRGGDSLWIYDPQTGEVVACYLRTDVFGEQFVRCTPN